MTLRNALLTGLLIAAAGLGACHGNRADDAARDAAVGSPQEPATPVEARRVSTDAAAELVYAPWTADEDGRRLRVERVRADGGGAADDRWEVRETLTPAAGGGKERTLRVGRMVVDPDGAALLVGETNHEEGVEVVFTPPLVAMPARLDPETTDADAAHVQEFEMVIRDLKNPDRVRVRGTARHEIVYTGDATITTPAGVFTARTVRSTLTADLSPSRVRNVTESWYVDGLGLVAERRTERTEVMGIAVRSNAEAWILAEAPGGGQSDGRP